MKICKKCGLERENNEFHRDKHNPDGLTYHCKKCRNTQYSEYYMKNPEKQKIKNDSQKNNRKKYYRSESGIESSRKAHLKKKFNISLNEYNRLSELQNHTCAICGQKEEYYRNRVLCVDHNHNTNNIRGLLCNTCNRALGLFKEDKNNLQNAIKYLQNNE